jgi:hypothetical protein
MAAAANVKLDEDSQAVYLEQLASLDLGDLQQAVNRTIREWDKPHMMPPISFILDRAGNNKELLAEAAWESLQKFIYRDWHPDIGFTSSKRLDAITEYAVRQCGGLAAIHNCKTDSAAFKRKEFLSAYQRFAVEGGKQLYLSSEDAKKFLKDLEQGRLGEGDGLPS